MWVRLKRLYAGDTLHDGLVRAHPYGVGPPTEHVEIPDPEQAVLLLWHQPLDDEPAVDEVPQGHVRKSVVDPVRQSVACPPPDLPPLPASRSVPQLGKGSEPFLRLAAVIAI